VASLPFHTIELQESVLVEAVPLAVYAMISDVTRMGEWSPECLRSAWTSGIPGEVGSTFVGTNYEQNIATGQEWEWEWEWDMACEVVTAEPPVDFAWTVLSQAWDRNTTGWQPILDRHGRERQLQLVAARRDRLNRGMRTTLDAIAAAASALAEPQSDTITER